MAPLVARGWVQSGPGPAGGYLAAIDLGEINVLEVIEAVEGPTDSGQCVLEERTCLRSGPCALHEPWSRARSQLLAELAVTSLSALPTPGAAAVRNPEVSR